VIRWMHPPWAARESASIFCISLPRRAFTVIAGVLITEGARGEGRATSLLLYGSCGENDFQLSVEQLCRGATKSSAQTDCHERSHAPRLIDSGKR
jgi:hypothetical protein